VTLPIPLPEPIFTETVSDIDATDNDVEVELSAMSLRALRGGASFASAEIEAEWMVMGALGFRLEGRLATPGVLVGGTAGVSWKLLRDFRRDVYLQVEAVAHTLDRNDIVDPGESASPLAFDVRIGKRAGPVTLRGSAGVGVGASHLGARGSVAVLTGFGPSTRFGFWGLELDADTSRPSPFVAALDIEPNLAALGLPFRVALAIPWNINTDATQPSLGVFVRLFFESPREIEYGRTGR
jgi:hypothetical protein